MKYGRLPRRFDPRVPKMAELRQFSGAPLPALPEDVNHMFGMPANLGAMLNDQLGDCTCAAVGHGIQLWSFDADGAGGMVTPPDSSIEQLYELAAGYVPGDPTTDQGADMQTVLQTWMKNPVDGNALLGFAEVDVNDIDEVKRTIWECGFIYIGFNVPAYFQSLEGAGSVWALPGEFDVPADADMSVIDGHAVILPGYSSQHNHFPTESWGSEFMMTLGFWRKYVDEAYGLWNSAWIKSTGRSPAGLTIEQIEALMQSMKQ